nr:MAG TPA: hypothetical protein [Caudoviricetes sp.]
MTKVSLSCIICNVNREGTFCTPTNVDYLVHDE